MYWYYGQQDMKAAALLKDEDNIFVTYVSNFSCAPDSFMLHTSSGSWAPSPS
jgi:predicted nucleotide-binding protein (sugar kinase/HSP70/actin superfamily)